MFFLFFFLSPEFIPLRRVDLLGWNDPTIVGANGLDRVYNIYKKAALILLIRRIHYYVTEAFQTDMGETG